MSHGVERGGAEMKTWEPWRVRRQESRDGRVPKGEAGRNAHLS